MSETNDMSIFKADYQTKQLKKQLKANEDTLKDLRSMVKDKKAQDEIAKQVLSTTAEIAKLTKTLELD